MLREPSTNRYKYRDDHAILSCDCPMENELSDHEGVAFRFVHEDTTHPNCSLPNSKINSARKPNDCKKACGGYALSFYVSLEQARNSYSYCVENFKNFKQIVGGHIAECKLTSSDGRREAIASDGHFNFHEFEGTDLTNRFENIAAAQP